MGTLGGALKRRQKISGRLADARAYLYLASCTLKRYHGGRRAPGELDLARWGVELCLYRVQQALRGVIHNLPVRPATRSRTSAGILSADERETLRAARECREEVIAVDAFDAETYHCPR